MADEGGEVTRNESLPVTTYRIETRGSYEEINKDFNQSTIAPVADEYHRITLFYAFSKKQETLDLNDSNNNGAE